MAGPTSILLTPVVGSGVISNTPSGAAYGFSPGQTIVAAQDDIPMLESFGFTLAQPVNVGFTGSISIGAVSLLGGTNAIGTVAVSGGTITTTAPVGGATSANQLTEIADLGSIVANTGSILTAVQGPIPAGSAVIGAVTGTGTFVTQDSGANTTGILAAVGTQGDAAWSGTGNATEIATQKAIVTLLKAPLVAIDALLSNAGYVVGTSAEFQNVATINGTTAVTLVAATSGLHNFVTDLLLTRTDTGTLMAYVTLNDAIATPLPLPPAGGATITRKVPIKSNGTNAAITFTSQAGVTGFVAAAGFSGT